MDLGDTKDGCVFWVTKADFSPAIVSEALGLGKTSFAPQNRPNKRDTKKFS